MEVTETFPSLLVKLYADDVRIYLSPSDFMTRLSPFIIITSVLRPARV